MATTTPNYGWTVPTSTDLVKDGATAIETLGDAIDASMNTALGTKKAGMVLLNTTSFSGVSSQAVSSFASSTYTNYRMVLRVTNTTADASITLKFRSGTTDSSASYNWAEWIVNRAGASATQYGNGGTSGFDIGKLDISGLEDYYFMTSDIVGINTAFPTGITFLGWFVNTDGTMFQLSGAGTHAVRSAFDGINIISSSGNMTGDVSIYGYNK